MSFSYENGRCEVTDDCLQCPLSRCRADNERWYRALLENGRHAYAVSLWESGLTLRQVAGTLGYAAEGYVYRAINRIKSADYSPQDIEASARIYVERGGVVYPTPATDEETPAPTPTRFCLDCGADISDRHGNSKRCPACAIIVHAHQRQLRNERLQKGKE